MALLLDHCTIPRLSFLEPVLQNLQLQLVTAALLQVPFNLVLQQNDGLGSGCAPGLVIGRQFYDGVLGLLLLGVAVLLTAAVHYKVY